MTEMNTMKTTTAVATSGFAESELFSFVFAAFDSASTELLLFLVAAVAYFALFMQRTPRNSKLLAKKIKVFQEDCDEPTYLTDASLKGDSVGPNERAGAEKALQVAFDAGDYHSVLRCWNSMKKFEKMPIVSLPNVVESMQRFKKDTPFILRELKGFLKKFPSECDMTCINDLLETLGKRLDSDLMEKIVEMLPSMDLQMDECTYEIFLNMHFTTRNFEEVKTLVSQMKANQVPFTTRATMTVIKTALKTNSFEEALLSFRQLKSTWICSSPSSTPAHIVSQLVELACKTHQLGDLIPELHGMPISE